MEQDLEKLYEDHIHWNSYPASKPWKPTQASKPNISGLLWPSMMQKLDRIFIESGLK